jgi:hypothetical protein
VQGLGVLMAAIFLAGQMAGVGVLALPAALIVNIFSYNLYPNSFKVLLKNYLFRMTYPYMFTPSTN